jgi:hypothetical protein
MGQVDLSLSLIAVRYDCDSRHSDPPLCPVVYGYSLPHYAAKETGGFLAIDRPMYQPHKFVGATLTIHKRQVIANHLFVMMSILVPIIPIR